MGYWITVDHTLVAQILRINSTYTPPPPDGFFNPTLLGMEEHVVDRFVKAGIPAENISFSRETFNFRALYSQENISSFPAFQCSALPVIHRSLHMGFKILNPYKNFCLRLVLLSLFRPSKPLSPLQPLKPLKPFCLNYLSLPNAKESITFTNHYCNLSVLPLCQVISLSTQPS